MWAEPRSEIVVVGTGIKGANHFTAEALAHIMSADTVLYCVADLIGERHIKRLNANCVDLYTLYGNDKPRRQTYDEMTQAILDAARTHKKVCVVFYGHPGIFVWSTYAAIEAARADGIKAYMLPAVSALDCLFADIGVDPSRRGCQVLEATDLLIRAKKPDVTAAVVLFQVGCVGDAGFNFKGYDRRNVPVLEEYLAGFYGADYEIVFYEAAQYPFCPPNIKKIKISELSASRPSGITTVYIPPKEVPPVDLTMARRLGLIKDNNGQSTSVSQHAEVR